MTSDQTYPQHAILFVDDEVQSQKYFSQIFGRIFKVHLASDGEEGLKLYQEHRKEIGVVVSDQRMPGMSGSQMLTEITKDSTDVVKILSTAYSDLEAAIDAVNEGGIYRYVTKPWDLAELEVTLRRAMDYYLLKEQHRSLAQTKIAGLEQVFHQSRLLACLAVPALLKENPFFIRALRDLLRLSLNQNSATSPPAGHLEALTLSDRQELAEKVGIQLREVIDLESKLDAPTPGEIEHLADQLSASDSPNGSKPLHQSLLDLLYGKPQDAHLADLAGFLRAYEAGYEIQRHDSRFILVRTEENSESPSVFEELYSLFVDDSFLVNLVIGESADH